VVLCWSCICLTSVFVSAVQGMERQITPEMIGFYASYRENSANGG